MQDILIEYMVKRQNGPKAAMLKVLIILASIIMAWFFLQLSAVLGQLSFIAVLFAVGAFYGAYLLITSMNLEFEYSITNGEMDVDKIIAQRKRRRLASIKWREVEAFGRYAPADHAQKNYANKIFACDNINSDDLWYCLARVPQKGQVFLVFNATERMLDAIKKYLPKQLLFAVFKKS